MSTLAKTNDPFVRFFPLPLYRFSRGQYLRLIRSDILSDRKELKFDQGLILSRHESAAAPAVSVFISPNGDDTATAPLPVRRFTVHEYHRLGAEGILAEGEGVELIEGWLVTKMSRNPPHDAVLLLTLAAISSRLPVGWHCRPQTAVTMKRSEPEPDLAVVRGQVRDYTRVHPTPQDTALAIEVADSSLWMDRNVKGAVYAQREIPLYWILNVRKREIEVFSDPTGPARRPRYREKQIRTIEESVSLVLPDQRVISIPIRNLFP